jgi:hypothetical protein
MRTIILTATAVAATAIAFPACAQIASTAPNPEAPSGWTFAIAPYGWLPTIRAGLDFNRPRGGTVTTNVSAGIGDYISKLNFALMGGAEARDDRFTIMTDLIYTNASLTQSEAHISSFNPGNGAIGVSTAQQLAVGTRMATTIWSIAGGYTVLQGPWGNVDGVLGMRMLVTGATTNYALTQDIILPNRTLGLSRDGSLTLSTVNPEAIFGVKARFDIPNSRFYIPFYVDAGTGALPFTWQIYTGIAYRLADWADITAGYRYMAFQTGSSRGLHNLSLGGALVAANFRF